MQHGHYHDGFPRGFEAISEDGVALAAEAINKDRHSLNVSSRANMGCVCDLLNIGSCTSYNEWQQQW